MNKIPDGWEITSISEVTAPITKINLKSAPDKQIKYIDISSIDRRNNTIVDAKTLSLKQAPSRARQVVKENDILFSTVRPYLRNIAAVPQELDGEIASTGFSVLRPVSLIEPQYLYYYCLSNKFVDSVSKQQYGVSYPAVKDSHIRSQSIPLPPLPEQKRIVEKLNQICLEISSIRTRLESLSAALKKLRQSIYDAAVTGNLSGSWREKNLFPSADDLRKIVWLEREGERNYRALFKEEETPIEIKIPEGWTILNLDKICLKFTYGSSQKSQKNGDVPVLRMGNIQRGALDWDDLVYSSDKKEIEKYTLQSGDVLFNRTNSPELVGKSAIFNGEREAIYAGYLIKISPAKSLNSEYLNICLNSSYAKDYCWKVKTDGVSQSNINAKKLGKMPIPFCSIQEQVFIAKKAIELLSVADQVEEKCNTTIKKLNIVTQSILDKAFAGEMNTRDPNDEHASILVEEIRKNKAKVRENEVGSQPKKSSSKSKAKKDMLMVKSIQAILSEQKGWLTAQEVFQLCGIENGAKTEEIEILYAELRHLDKLNRLETDPVYDSEGKKQYDRLKLKTVG